MTEHCTIWASLPVPAFLIDESDIVFDVNSAGEGFLNTSARAIAGRPVWDMIAVDAPIETAFERARGERHAALRQRRRRGCGTAAAAAMYAPDCPARR